MTPLTYTYQVTIRLGDAVATAEGTVQIDVAKDTHNEAIVDVIAAGARLAAEKEIGGIPNYVQWILPRPIDPQEVEWRRVQHVCGKCRRKYIHRLLGPPSGRRAAKEGLVALLQRVHEQWTRDGKLEEEGQGHKIFAEEIERARNWPEERRTSEMYLVALEQTAAYGPTRKRGWARRELARLRSEKP